MPMVGPSQVECSRLPSPSLFANICQTSPCLRQNSLEPLLIGRPIPRKLITLLPPEGARQHPAAGYCLAGAGPGALALTDGSGRPRGGLQAPREVREIQAQPQKHHPQQPWQHWPLWREDPGGSWCPRVLGRGISPGLRLPRHWSPLRWLDLTAGVGGRGPPCGTRPSPPPLLLPSRRWEVRYSD